MHKQRTIQRRVASIVLSDEFISMAIIYVQIDRSSAQNECKLTHHIVAPCVARPLMKKNCLQIRWNRLLAAVRK